MICICTGHTVARAFVFLTEGLLSRLEQAEDQMWSNLENDEDLMKGILQIPMHSFESGKRQMDAIERVLNGLKRKIAMFKWQYRELLELVSSTTIQNAGKRIQASFSNT